MEEKKLTDEEIVKRVEMSAYGGRKYSFEEWDKCKTVSQSDVLDLIHRQKAEIEGLKEDVKAFKDFSDKLIDERENMQAVIFGLEEEKRQLQERYLEESKERCKYEQAYNKKCHEHNIGLGVQRKHWEKKVEQSVKDTAKEILQAVLEDVGEFFAGDIVEELSERYGVEVEW